MAEQKQHKQRRKPRLPLSPRLRHKCLAWGPIYRLALAVGVMHPARLSHLLCSDTIPNTPHNVKTLERIAQAVGFSGPIFLDAPTESRTGTQEGAHV